MFLCGIAHRYGFLYKIDNRLKIMVLKNWKSMGGPATWFTVDLATFLARNRNANDLVLLRIPTTEFKKVMMITNLNKGIINLSESYHGQQHWVEINNNPACLSS